MFLYCYYYVSCFKSYVLLCTLNVEHNLISLMSENDICLTMSLRHKIAPLNCKLEAVISSLKNAYLIQSEGNIFLSRVPIADLGGGGGGQKNMCIRRHRFICYLNNKKKSNK
jgi:hypothetical protein